MTKTDAMGESATGVSISKEMAGETFEFFARKWKIHTDVAEMSEDSESGFLENKRKIVTAIQEGLLTVADDGTIHYKLEFPVESLRELHIRFPTGAAIIGFDRLKDGHNQAMMNSFLASVTEQPAAVFSILDMRDLKPIHSVVTLFLAS